MPMSYDLLTLLVVLQLTVHDSWTLASRMGPRKSCPACKESLGAGRGHVAEKQAAEDSTSVLALGEPCGVYTLSCGRGLRCKPPPSDPSPLHALLQGRGVCRSLKTAINPQTPVTRPPVHIIESEKGPCRKLLTVVLRRLELTVFQSDHNLYIPNCDKRGFYLKKQCRSSRGMQRGQCWCVNESGTMMTSRTAEDGTVSCDSA
ncbi:insulin-like growth factor-binding protein 3 [Denticeps clupeoides]|uniref:Thyroglobulin type-1 domain-containing protein n=1 Tax=Denticeps clupeoides TaxID=299321 RepID=A0AAY4D8T5_9TELE|nr:insulin-like growth factor-binding protein 3 [Denticeps clupeoides]XP_028854619.1 insulin-like growth factor-binding protein 3 [Denticeps clupeoides]